MYNIFLFNELEKKKNVYYFILEVSFKHLIIKKYTIGFTKCIFSTLCVGQRKKTNSTQIFNFND